MINIDNGSFLLIISVLQELLILFFIFPNNENAIFRYYIRINQIIIK